jgi:hypothetical protein
VTVRELHHLIPAGKMFFDDDEVQDLINVWTMPATMLKNKVMYRQFIHSVAFVD